MSSDRTQLIDQGTMVYPLDPALAQSSQACPHCSSQISPGEQFCTRCGFQRGTWRPKAAAAAPSAVVSRPAAASGPALFTLGAADGSSYSLPAGEWILGRGEVDLRIDDSYISRSHAKLVVSSDAVSVTDLGSSNGSFIGGRRMSANETVTLRSGESISFGRTEFLLSTADAAAANDGDVEVADSVSPGLEEIAPAGSIASETAEVGAQQLSGWAIVAESGETIDIPEGGLSIGRKADKAQHVVSDGYVSSLHCRLEPAVENLILIDLGSTNGSFVGETRLEPNAPVELQDGDSFRIGQTIFSVQSREDGPAESAGSAEPPGSPGEADLPQV